MLSQISYIKFRIKRSDSFFPSIFIFEKGNSRPKSSGSVTQRQRAHKAKPWFQIEEATHSNSNIQTERISCNWQFMKTLRDILCLIDKTYLKLYLLLLLLQYQPTLSCKLNSHPIDKQAPDYTRPTQKSISNKIKAHYAQRSACNQKNDLWLKTCHFTPTGESLLT